MAYYHLKDKQGNSYSGFVPTKVGTRIGVKDCEFRDIHGNLYSGYVSDTACSDTNFKTEVIENRSLIDSILGLVAYIFCLIKFDWNFMIIDKDFFDFSNGIPLTQFTILVFIIHIIKNCILCFYDYGEISLKALYIDTWELGREIRERCKRFIIIALICLALYGTARIFGW